MKAYEQSRMLAVKGVVRKDKNGDLKRIDSVEHVSLLHPLDVETRLEELANLKDRWLNGKGVALDRARLKALAEEFEKHFDATLPLPYLYPTPEGGVLAEWTLGKWAVSLDIEITTQTAGYEALNLDSNEASELTLNLSEPSGWTSLNNELRQLNVPMGSK